MWSGLSRALSLGSREEYMAYRVGVGSQRWEGLCKGLVCFFPLGARSHRKFLSREGLQPLFWGSDV